MGLLPYVFIYIMSQFRFLIDDLGICICQLHRIIIHSMVLGEMFKR